MSILTIQIRHLSQFIKYCVNSFAVNHVRGFYAASPNEIDNILILRLCFMMIAYRLRRNT
ncbi:hypothetical protein THOG11_220034 [Vibrio harveyi]|nr:hypothetical protein TH15OA1_280027 [Vibrio harveyi]CAH1560470.1 hypothetical protein THOD03_250035 [Vibrio harveyi]CAH1566224.1 hypothetical protein THOG11_220034 [Vibrio harveyi]